MNHPLKVLFDRTKEGSENDFASFSNENDLNCQDLWNSSNSLADTLVDCGVYDDKRIILAGKNSRNTLISLVACWLAGGIVLPIEPNIDSDKKELIRRRFGADYILDSENVTLTCCNDEKQIELFWEEQKYNNGSGCYLKKINPGKASLCLYTSGSTGQPKGVLLSLEALGIGANNVIDSFKLLSDDLGFCVLPLTHINGLVTTLLAPLYSKSRVHFYQGNFFERMTEVFNEMEEKQCTWLSAIPMHYVAMNSFNKVNKYKLSLRFCRSAAAPLSPKVLSNFEKKYKIPLIETLGMTETAGQIFANPLPPEIHKPGSVGKPVNFEVIVIDAKGKEVTNGEIGEVAVRGNSMMLGYIDDHGTTAQSFINNRLKTGDLAKVDNDGYYYILGRKKHMAIFAGINIPLGQIENLITEYDEIFAVICKARNHFLFGEVFDIYIEKSKGLDNSVINNEKYLRKIKKRLLPYLPSMQAIGNIIIMDELPRTSLGKLDRSKL